MIDLSKLNVWFITGSQHLYGPETLQQVAADAQAIVGGLSGAAGIPVGVVFKPVVTTPESILEVCRAANNAADCIGLVLWMHTFSPAKMWIAGLVGSAQALPAPAHPVQPRHPLGRRSTWTS